MLPLDRAFTARSPRPLSFVPAELLRMIPLRTKVEQETLDWVLMMARHLGVSDDEIVRRCISQTRLDGLRDKRTTQHQRSLRFIGEAKSRSMRKGGVNA